MRPASICRNGSDVLAMPVLAHVASRNCAMPYAVLVGFCAVGVQLLSAYHRSTRQSNWVAFVTRASA